MDTLLAIQAGSDKTFHVGTIAGRVSEKLDVDGDANTGDDVQALTKTVIKETRAPLKAKTAAAVPAEPAASAAAAPPAEKTGGKRWKYMGKKGYLDTKTTGFLGFGGWKRKLYVAEGPKLKYLDESDKAQTIDLRECTITKNDDDKDGKVFTIQSQKDPKKVLVLRTALPEECDKWVEVLGELKGGAKAWHVGDVQTSEGYHAPGEEGPEDQFEAVEISKSGSAWKKPRNRSGVSGSKFQLRFLELDSHGMLSYYKTAAEAKQGPKEHQQINVAGATVVPLGYDGKLYTFEITSNNGERVVLGQEAADDTAAWIEALKAAAGHHGKRLVPMRKQRSRRLKPHRAIGSSKNLDKGADEEKADEADNLVAANGDEPLPQEIELRFLRDDVALEKEVTDEVTAKVAPWMELATPVVIGTPHGYDLKKTYKITIPLKKGPSRVAQVLHKADARDDTPWTIIDEDDYEQRDSTSCTVSVSHLCYFAVLRPVNKKLVLKAKDADEAKSWVEALKTLQAGDASTPVEAGAEPDQAGFLGKKEMGEPDFKRTYFAAAGKKLKFGNEEEDPVALLGTVDLDEVEIMAEEDDPTVFTLEATPDKVEAAAVARATSKNLTPEDVDAEFGAFRPSTGADDVDQEAPVLNLTTGKGAPVTVRFLDADTPSEVAVTQSAVAAAKEGDSPMKLAADVIMATPTNPTKSTEEAVADGVRVTLPLRGPGEVKAVLGKADDDAPWVPLPDACFTQGEGDAAQKCTVTLQPVKYYAVLRDDAEKTFTTNYYKIGDALKTKSPEEVEAYWAVVSKSGRKRDLFDAVISKRDRELEKAKYTKTGVAWKKGRNRKGLGAGNFKLRFFDLDGNGTLSYYSSAKEADEAHNHKSGGTDSAKSMNIADAKVKPLGYDGQFYSWEVTAKNGDKLVLGEEDPAEAQAWIEILKGASAYHSDKQGGFTSSLPVVDEQEEDEDVTEALADKNVAGKQGYLDQAVEAKTSQWVKRFFVAEGAYLQFTDKADDDVALGTIDLREQVRGRI